MKFTMNLDKVTKNAVRYSDGDGHNIYLTKEEAATMSTPVKVSVVIEPS